MKTFFLVFLFLIVAIQSYGQTTNYCNMLQACGPSGSTQLVQNGDFSAGNVGFTSSLPFLNACMIGSYSVGSQPTDKCTATGWSNGIWDWNQNNASGSYLIIDGTPGNSVVWQQDVYLENGKNYLFAFNVLPALTTINNGQTLTVTANGQSVLTSNTGSYTEGVTNWNNKCAGFNYTGPTGNFPLTITQMGFVGNIDYGIDGISLTTCCTPVEATQPNYSICCSDGRITIGAEWIPTGNVYWTNNFFTPIDGYGNHTGPVGGAFTNLPCGVTTEDFGNFRLYYFDPCECQTGIHPLEYTYTNISNGCIGSATMNIEVLAPPTISFPTMTINLCQDNSPIALNPITNGTSCSFSGNHITSQGVFNPQSAGVGTHTFDITCTNANNCSNTITGTIIVEEDGQWHQTTQNTVRGLDIANDVITDKEGNVYVVGTFADETTLRGGSNTPDITLSANAFFGGNNYTNTFVAKYDQCGDLIWAANSSKYAYNTGTGIAIDENNRVVYITGNFLKDLIFSSAQNNINPNACNSFSSISITNTTNTGYVAQFDMESGCLNFVESVVHANSSFTDCRAITIDENDGQIYVGGQFREVSQGLNFFARKYIPTTGFGQNNTLGNVIWSVFDLVGDPSHYSTLNDMDYNETNDQLWIIGSYVRSFRSGDSQGGPGGITGVSNATMDAYFTTYRDAGNAPIFITLEKGFAPAGGLMTGEGIAIDEVSGYSFYTGTYIGTVNNAFDFSTINPLNNPSSQTYSYMIGASSSGTSSWAKSGTGSTSGGKVEGKAVDCTAGKAYFTGYWGGSNAVSFTGNGNYSMLGGLEGRRVYAAAYHITGNALWANVTKGSNSTTDNHRSNAIAVDNLGHAFIVGDYRGTIDYFNGTPANGTLVSSPASGVNYNAFFMRTQQDNGAFRQSNQVNDIVEEETVDQLIVYPNPTTGLFTVQFNTEIENGLVEILDITGRVIYTEEVNNNKDMLSFDLKDRPQGVYLVKLTTNGTTQVKKLIHQ